MSGVYPVRRLSSNVVHLVEPAGTSGYRASHFGAFFYGIDSPAVALCRAILHEGPGGALVWMQSDPTCRACKRFAQGREVQHAPPVKSLQPVAVPPPEETP